MTDPAETTRLRQAVSTQGTRLTHHEAALTDFKAQLQAMSTQQIDLIAAVQNLSHQVTNPPAPVPIIVHQPPPPSQPAHDGESRIPTPERYNGDLGTCGPFLTQCSLFFEHQPRSFASDRSRIAYLVNLLKGLALEWASAVWDQQIPICHSYPNFVLEIRSPRPWQGRGEAAPVTPSRLGKCGRDGN